MSFIDYKPRARAKGLEEKIVLLGMRLALVIIFSVLGMILFSIAYEGIPTMSLEMITQCPKGGFYYGKEGGVLNALTGSLYLSLAAVVIALAIGLPVALYINVFLKRQPLIVRAIRFLLDLLWGVPSIVYGAFAFTIMIYCGLRASLLAGSITIAVLILPIIIRSLDEVLRGVSQGLHEAAASLGSTGTQIAFKVYLRQCLPGLVTALLLSFGRAIGDTAAVLFTSGYTDHIPHSPTEPAATLPLAIFFQLSSPIPEVRQRAYAAAFILSVIILIVSTIARLLSSRFEKNRIQY